LWHPLLETTTNSTSGFTCALVVFMAGIETDAAKGRCQSQGIRILELNLHCQVLLSVAAAVFSWSKVLLTENPSSVVSATHA
jgi:hypothetical protein